ncbi:MAG: Stk1 family PASTA domain-containing Ser/Thr kinase [Ruminococcus sp.]|nr:Stk1 family PASTA domain-containing Ser/Thr kinase [Ruminococcus sp.]
MLKTGVVLGKRYEILGRIGAGGMADVYKSKDHKLNRYVAVKVLKSTYRSDEVFLKKFLSEAQAAAGMMHPNVVNVYDVGEDRGLYYMVMELVEGITLKDYIEKKGRLSAKETISISIQMITGIQAAHNQHIIHRDIKPQNILISKEGKVKVTDFGIARATTSTQTISTNVMGSVHYTSPEQARGGVVGESSDIYSAGVTMYEMITGHVPFDGETTVEVAVKHLQEAFPEPSAEVRDIPYSLECIIMKCTQKNTAMRYKNCQELINDLKRSLIDPEGDFVMNPAAGTRVRTDSTIIMSTGEIERANRRRPAQRNDYNNNYNSSYNNKYDDDYDDEDDDDYDDQYSRKSQDRSRTGGSSSVNSSTKQIMKILMVVAAVVIAFAILFMIGNAAGIFKSVPGLVTEEEETQVTVPNVIGMTEDEAKAALNKEGLGYDVEGRETSDKYAKGEIMGQSVDANKKVDKNTTIYVTISLGEEVKKVSIPDVVEMDEDKAKKALDDKKLVVTTDYKFDSNVESGKVISTDPAAGTEVDEGTKVKMYVSKGSEKVKVPNVVNKSSSSAQQAITAEGLNVTVTEDYSDKVEAGYVISQNPDGGSKVEKGATVNIVVSLGPKTVMADVPHVVGDNKSQAEQEIRSAGLEVNVVEEYNSNVTAGYVISQSAAGGSQVEAGTTITIYVSLGPEPVTPTPESPESGETVTE